MAQALAGQEGSVQDSRDRLDEMLASEERSSTVDPEERELRDALGLK